MLTNLRIQNIILIESADIHFGTDLNVLSGETGAGKSAILNALHLVTGERADPGLIRRGTDKGVVEAVFDISHIPQLKVLLEAGGIDHEIGEELIIRREIFAAGKSRAFINNQQIQLTQLRNVSAWLLEMVGQHANQKLLLVENHREIVDTYGGLRHELDEFAKSWSQENSCRTHLEELVRSEAQRLRDIDICQMELEELSSARLKEGEDEDLFAEYSLLSNAEELSCKANEIDQVLSGERLAILPLLCRQQQTFTQLVNMDPSLADTAKAYDNALIELNEIAHTLRIYHSRIENNPGRTLEINERLCLIDRLKKRYGSNITEIQTYEKNVREKLANLQGSDSEIEQLKITLENLESHNNLLCQQITKRRVQAAQQLEKELRTELHALNMTKADFHCIVSQHTRCRFGDDRIEFFLTPNIGEHRIPIKECASGGELSRVMLAVQTLLAGKAQIPTLIFDEIDSNIGGETASIVGEKLRRIGKQHQVICITHFPQVAKEAHHHLQISKMEQDGRTITVVTSLDAKMRKKELLRMLGGQELYTRT